jgi:SAM-dependent methyltransferase
MSLCHDCNERAVFPENKPVLCSYHYEKNESIRPMLHFPLMTGHAICIGFAAAPLPTCTGKIYAFDPLYNQTGIDEQTGVSYFAEELTTNTCYMQFDENSIDNIVFDWSVWKSVNKQRPLLTALIRLLTTGGRLWVEDHDFHNPGGGTAVVFTHADVQQILPIIRDIFVPPDRFVRLYNNGSLGPEYDSTMDYIRRRFQEFLSRFNLSVVNTTIPIDNSDILNRPYLLYITICKQAVSQ